MSCQKLNTSNNTFYIMAVQLQLEKRFSERYNFRLYSRCDEHTARLVRNLNNVFFDNISTLYKIWAANQEFAVWFLFSIYCLENVRKNKNCARKKEEKGVSFLQLKQSRRNNFSCNSIIISKIIHCPKKSATNWLCMLNLWAQNACPKHPYECFID